MKHGTLFWLENIPCDFTLNILTMSSKCKIYLHPLAFAPMPGPNTALYICLFSHVTIYFISLLNGVSLNLDEDARVLP